MPSLLRIDQANRLDEAIFYIASGGALSVAVFTVGAAATMPELGLVGAELTLLGGLVSWAMRRWRPARAVFFGLVLGAVAAAFWLLRIQQSYEVIQHDPGLILALHMSVALVAISYVLVRAEIAAFSLVPGLSVMGLAAGQGDEASARMGFTIFLPLALLAVGYAMLSTGTIAGAVHRLPEAPAQAKGALHWRVRHWPTLAGVIIAIMAVAELFYFPLQQWADAHRWSIIYAIASPGTSHMPAGEPMEAGSTYRVGMGPIQLNENPVLTFTGESAPYWRGEVYDQYLGSSWRRTGAVGVRSELAAFPENGVLDLAEASEKGPLVSHDVLVNVDLPFVFYAPGVVRRIAAEGPLYIPAASHVVVNGYDVVEMRGGTLRAGSRYEVRSVPLEPSKGRVPEREPPGDIYLKVPFEANQVAELARSITAQEPTPARKLAALVGYLQRNCTYSLEAPATPPGYDAVDYFVMHQKVGYCDLFASALAVMGRAAGIPTRLVTGYAFPRPVEGAPAGGGQQFVLTEADGHAWVEAYLPEEGGWITADATPAVEDRRAVSQSWWERSALGLQVLWQTRPLVALAYALSALLALVGLVMLARRVLQLGRGEPAPVSAEDLRREMARLYLRFCHVLRRHGYARHASQTPREYLASLERRWPEREGPLEALPWARALTEQFVLARYGGQPTTVEMVHAARENLVEVRRALRPRRGKVAAAGAAAK